MEKGEKPIERHFAEWFGEEFGFGYGTGEPHMLAALSGFMEAVGGEGSPNAYDYQVMERRLTPTVAWLMINALCRCNVIEYGTSPRFGWLTPQGIALKAFTAGRSVDDLVAVAMIDDLDHCAPNFCNCGPDGYSKKKLCHNPFWREVA